MHHAVPVAAKLIHALSHDTGAEAAPFMQATQTVSKVLAGGGRGLSPTEKDSRGVSKRVIELNVSVGCNLF